MDKPEIAYFDNAATTFPKPEIVYKTMDSFYRSCGVNVGRGVSKSSISASSMVRETRQLILELFHCRNAQVVFEPSATIALNQVIRGLNWSEGDTVYITPFEHNAVLRPLNYLTEIFHLKIKELYVDRKTITYDLEKIKGQFLDCPPNVVIATHASNVCGVVAPIEEIFKEAKKYKSITIVDMSQTAGLIDTDLGQAQADYAIFAGHKTLYGPFGIAGFLKRTDDILSPLIYGGTGVDSANPFMPERAPLRYEAGSQNIYAIAGLNASLKWILDVGVGTIYVRDQQMLHDVSDILTNCKIITKYRSKSKNIGLISFNIKGYTSDSLTNYLTNNRIACRTGLHCAPLAHKFLGTFPSGTIRFSFGYFNTEKEIDLLYSMINQIAENIE